MTDEAKLVAAILSRDFDAAVSLLEEMKWTSSKWARDYLIGRNIAFPPAPLPKLDEPFVLPVPDHLPGSTLGDPRKAA